MQSAVAPKAFHPSIIKDSLLAPAGERKLAWVKSYMPLMNSLFSDLSENKPLQDKTILCCLHLEAKTGYLLQTLQAAGARVAACASNPLSTQDDVVAALVKSGITVYAIHGESTDDYQRFINLALDCHPDAIIDDGADVVSTILSDRPQQAREIIGGCEETTTGVLRLKAMEADQALLFPMIAVNDAYMKYLFDNRYGTGQSVWNGINRATNLIVAGKSVVVAGYGWCGKGVAMRAQGLGARVIVTEIDPIKANEALMEGFTVMPMQQAAAIGDVFITVTGNINVIRKEHMLAMKNGVLLANAGHFDVEISKSDLADLAVKRDKLRDHTEIYTLANGRQVVLLAEGRLVNLAAGDGHPAEVMDLSFSLQVLSLLYLFKHSGELENKIYPVPAEIDRQVAFMKLRAERVAIDELTAEQADYLKAWQ